MERKSLEEKLFQAIGNVDEDLLARCPLPENPPGKQPSKNEARGRRLFAGRVRPALIFCVLFCLILTTALLLRSRFITGSSGEQDFPLSEASHGVKVSRIDSIPDSMPASSADLIWLTEEELFTYFDTHIFEGTVTDIQNIVMDFSGEPVYRAIASIQVGKVFRGSCIQGDTVKVLLPCPIGGQALWVEDTSVISQLRVGISGIFMPQVYNADSIRQQNGALLLLSDLAPYGLPDGERYAFLDTEEGPVFDRRSYESIQDVSSMAEITLYIEEMLENIQ